MNLPKYWPKELQNKNVAGFIFLAKFSAHTNEVMGPKWPGSANKREVVQKKWGEFEVQLDPETIGTHPNNVVTNGVAHCAIAMTLTLTLTPQVDPEVYPQQMSSCFVKFSPAPRKMK